MWSLSIGSEALENDGHDHNDDMADFLADRGLPVPFNLEEIFNGGYYAMPFNGTWISQNEIIYDDIMAGGIIKFNVETQKFSTIVEADVMVRRKYFVLINNVSF